MSTNFINNNVEAEEQKYQSDTLLTNLKTLNCLPVAGKSCFFKLFSNTFSPFLPVLMECS